MHLRTIPSFTSPICPVAKPSPVSPVVWRSSNTLMNLPHTQQCWQHKMQQNAQSCVVSPHCTSRSVVWVVTALRLQAQVLKQQSALWHVLVWRSAVSRMLPQSQLIPPVHQVLTVVAVSKLIVFLQKTFVLFQHSTLFGRFPQEKTASRSPFSLHEPILCILKNGILSCGLLTWFFNLWRLFLFPQFVSLFLVEHSHTTKALLFQGTKPVLFPTINIFYPTLLLLTCLILLAKSCNAWSSVYSLPHPLNDLTHMGMKEAATLVRVEIVLFMYCIEYCLNANDSSIDCWSVHTSWAGLRTGRSDEEEICSAEKGEMIIAMSAPLCHL